MIAATKSPEPVGSDGFNLADGCAPAIITYILDVPAAVSKRAGEKLSRTWRFAATTSGVSAVQLSFQIFGRRILLSLVQQPADPSHEFVERPGVLVHVHPLQHVDDFIFP
jgi:hypothetical protein